MNPQPSPTPPDAYPAREVQCLKFHGVYQEDDRDLRKTEAGKKHILLIRVRVPGGVLTPAQYLALDQLADRYGNQTLRITSRQTFQFHGVLKENLPAAIRAINDTLLTTLATCGDVVRNIITPSSPAHGRLGKQLLKQAKALSEALAPALPIYHGIWVDGKELDLCPEWDDPLYGKAPLPRKFKIAFALPPVNDTDVFTNDMGLIPIIAEEKQNGRRQKKIAGFNLAVGGGLGRSHGNAATFARLADVIGFLPPEHLEKTLRAAVTIHRDFSDRTNRKHARLKYLVAERGVDWFREELERRAGIRLESARPFAFDQQDDPLGWHTQSNKKRFLGLFIETGRIRDTAQRRVKSALRAIVETFQPEVRLTAGNNLILANIPADQVDAITAILREHGVPLPEQLSAIRRCSTACVSLPTCGLALAEAERFFPRLLDRVEAALREAGLGNLEKEPITLRISGCPNGCSRPAVAEIGLVGRAPGKYQLYLGGNTAGTRLNRLWKDSLTENEIVEALQPLFKRYAEERLAPSERFGDWATRALF